MNVIQLLCRGRHGHEFMGVGFTPTCTISTKVVSSNLANVEAYLIQQYVIQFVCDIRLVGGFLQGLRFPPLIKLTARI